jgi:hypothetical protein
MTAPIPAVASLPPKTRDILSTVVKPTFDGYIAVTANSTRSVPAADGQYFVYPSDITTTDLVFMWALLLRVYDAVGGPDDLAQLLQADSELLSDARAIVGGEPEHNQEGSFWQFPDAGQVPLDEAVGPKLGSVLKTLRNGFAHSHWVYKDLSALDYWQALGWETEGAKKQFHLQDRPARNYTMYVADASRPWDPANFWAMKDLRILATPSHVLRYRLHLMLNYILNGIRVDIFGSQQR